ncbi:MAG TPA: hypothetical protein VF519_05375 [Mycobacteriales bacterium]|jgi:hypothetical protein
MKKSLAAAILAGATLAPLAHAEPLPPACVVVNATPVPVQAGYAPNGPADCVVLPG